MELLRQPFLVSICLLIAASVSSAAPALDPLRFREEVDKLIAAAQEEGIQPGAVACVGSSSMRNWHDRIRTDLAPLTVIPLGFGGSLYQDLNYYFDELITPFKPRAIVVYEGDNDTAVGMTTTQILREFLTFVDKVESLDPGIRIYVISVKPSARRWSIWPDVQELNERIKLLCDAYPQLTYIDVATPLLDSDGFVRREYFIEDNLHLSAEGYNRWAEAVKRVVIPVERAFENKAAK